MDASVATPVEARVASSQGEPQNRGVGPVGSEGDRCSQLSLLLMPVRPVSLTLLYSLETELLVCRRAGGEGEEVDRAQESKSSELSTAAEAALESLGNAAPDCTIASVEACAKASEQLIRAAERTLSRYVTSLTRLSLTRLFAEIICIE